MLRTAAHVDANQASIVAVIRAIGAYALRLHQQESESNA
jgi:hypothetical protein